MLNDAEVLERLDVLRRVAERGLALAQASAPAMIDSWQHVLDEIGVFRARAERWSDLA